MQVGRGTDKHRVDIRACQNIPVVPVSVLHPQRIGQFLRGLKVDIRHRHQVGAGDAVDQVVGMKFADAPGADDANV